MDKDVTRLSEATEKAVAILAKGILELENPESYHFLSIETKSVLKALAGHGYPGHRDIDLRRLNPLLRKIVNAQAGIVNVTVDDVVTARDLLGLDSETDTESGGDS